MEERNEQFLSEGNVSDAVFGTSSDAIIDGLHQGVLATQSLGDDSSSAANDKNQIVNEQDQNGITNALEDDEFKNSAAEQMLQPATEYIAPMSKSEADAVLSDDDHLDEAGDSEEGVSSQNLEKDKLN